MISNIKNDFGHKKIIKNLFFGVGVFYTAGAVSMGSFDAIILIILYLLGFFIGWKFYISMASTNKYSPKNISNNDLFYMELIIILVFLGVFLIYLLKLNSYGLAVSEIISRKEMALLTRRDFIFSIADTILLTLLVYHTAVLVHFNIKRTFL